MSSGFPNLATHSTTYTTLKTMYHVEEGKVCAVVSQDVCCYSVLKI